MYYVILHLIAFFRNLAQGGTHESHLKSLINLQESVWKIITGDQYLLHSNNNKEILKNYSRIKESYCLEAVTIDFDNLKDFYKDTVAFSFYI